MPYPLSRSLLPALLAVCCTLAPASARTVTDSMGRVSEIPDTVERVVCSGPGCLRLLCYLEAQSLAVAVEDIEKRDSAFDARPYFLAHPEFKDLPLFGQFRGFESPERILGLPSRPQVILKANVQAGQDPDDLAAKTGIPVVVIDTGDLAGRREAFFAGLDLMARVVGRQERAAAARSFIEKALEDLRTRTAASPSVGGTRCYVGGIAFRGAHGLVSTDPNYLPFLAVGAANVAARPGRDAAAQASVTKEQILAWDPDVLFVDLATMQLGDQAGAIHELRTDPAYRSLRAAREGRVYAVPPYVWYSQNFCTTLAACYFTGKVLAPEGFADVDPVAKADEIYTFLLGRPLFARMDALFGGLAFRPLDVR